MAIESASIQIPNDLLEAFDPQSRVGVVAFVGSGPSCEAGLPNWPDLLRRIAADIGLDDQVNAYLQRGELLQVAEFLAGQRSQRDIKERAAKIIKQASHSPGRVHELIVSLPFAGIITTNYDLLLTIADRSQYFNLPITYKQSGLRTQLREHFLLHLHGHVNDPETIILTRQSYDETVLEDSQVESFLSSVFQSYVVLFIGFGFADSHLDGILREFKHLNAMGESSVFALISSPSPDTPDRVQQQNLRLRSINPIYLADRGDYGIGELINWLERLRDCLNQIARSLDSSVWSLRPRYLVQGLHRLFISDEWLSLLPDALSILPNRPDLKNLVRMGISKVDINRLFTRIGLSEMRAILIHLNKIQRHPILEDALSCFPPEAEDKNIRGYP